MLNSPKVSADNKLKIEFIGWDEPNNGRMLWVVNVLYTDRYINEVIFHNSGWNKINYQTDKWTINDEEDKFYYIPVEGISKLIVKQDFRIVDLPNQSLSTVRFIGNTFIGKNLIEVFRDQIVITDLKKFTSNIKVIEGISHVDDFRIIDNSTIEVVKYNYHEKTKLSRIVEI